MNNKSSTVIIGLGEMGSALGTILKNKNIPVDFWDKNIEVVKDQKTLAEIIPSADFLFFCVPSSAMIEAVKATLPFLGPQTIIISLAKGIEGPSKDTMDKLLEKLLPNGQNFIILSGPMLAEELSAGMNSVAIAGTKNKISFEKLSELFENTNLFLEYSDDVHSVALAGVLKNIYAITLGVADGLKWGENQKGWLISKSLQEMAQLMILLGGKKEIIYGPAGLGDLMATGCSPYSSNHKVGEEVVKTGQYLVSEGSKSLPIIIDLINANKEGFKILFALNKVLLEKQDAKTIFGQLFQQSE